VVGWLATQKSAARGCVTTPGRVAEPRATRSDVKNLCEGQYFVHGNGEAAPKTAEPPSHGAHPPAYPSIDAVVAHQRMLAAALHAHGVPRSLVPDAVQIVITAAWLAIRDGRYRPDHTAPPDVVLRRWLRAIAWRQVKNLRAAWTRREVPVSDPEPDVAADPHARLDARSELQVLRALPRELREVLLAFGHGQQLSELARDLGISEDTVWRRLHAGRVELAAQLAGRGWRRP
jgi:DNA-directed RNA polymerase specialized sigma24 family protein